MDRAQQLKTYLNKNSDVVVRQIFCCEKPISLVFLKSMIDKKELTSAVLVPLIKYKGKNISLDIIKTEILCSVEVEKQKYSTKLVDEIVQNKVVLILENSEEVLLMDMEFYPSRIPSEPPTSAVVQGPREGFTEDLKTNISLLRRRFPTPQLVLKNFNLGKYTKTSVVLCYIKGVASKKVVAGIEKRLNKIDIDGVIDSYYLFGFLQDKNYSVFKQTGSSEKPDVVAAKMLEGRVAIIVDGSPIVLTLPFLLIEDLQNSNDYYTNAYYITFIRIIRALGILIATIVPGVYLSLRLYHYKVLPLRYIVTIANSTQNLPFTPFLEILFILVLFQILYEVSLRLPRYLGLATSIVGALILGDTGVKAGLISPPTVIIIALSLISIYTVPEQAPQFTLLRALFIFLGGTVGIFGIVVGMIYIINYLCHIDAYGAPYLAPYAPRVNSDLKDALIKKPIGKMKQRPKSFENKNEVRMKNEDN